MKERVKNAAAILGLSELLDRKPAALSGGQRQRVALGRAIVRVPEGKLKVLREAGFKDGDHVIFGIRPEDIRSEPIAVDANPEALVKPTVSVSELLGAETMIYCNLGTNEFVARVDARSTFDPGEAVELAFNMSKSHFFDPETERVLR